MKMFRLATLNAAMALSMDVTQQQLAPCHCGAGCRRLLQGFAQIKVILCTMRALLWRVIPMMDTAAGLLQRIVVAFVLLTVHLGVSATSSPDLRAPQLMVKLAPNSSQGLTAEQALARLNGPDSVPENAALRAEAGYPISARFLITSRLSDEVRANLAANDPAELLHHWLVLEYSAVSASDTALNSMPGGSSTFLDVLQDYVGHFSAMPNDKFYATPAKVAGNGPFGTTGATAHGLMKVQDAWNDVTGQAYVSALDNGVRTTHPDLTANLRKHFSRNVAPLPDSPINLEEPAFTHPHAQGYKIRGHGTHVAGIIAAKGNNAIGTSGVCWSCSVAMMRTTLSSGGATCSTNIDAIKTAVDNGMQVVNISAGFPGCVGQQPMVDALDLLTQREISWSAAVGNRPNGVATVQFPASRLDAIAVGAATDSGALASFSSLGTTPGRWVDFIAPGDKILSTFYNDGIWESNSFVLDGQELPGTSCMLEFPQGGPIDAAISDYGHCSGTSMAAPMIAGALGLLRSANPLLTASDSKELLRVFAKQAASPSQDAGSGLPNVGASVYSALYGSIGSQGTTPLFVFYSTSQSNHFYTTVPQMGAAALCGTLKHGQDAVAPAGIGYAAATSEGSAVAGFAIPSPCNFSSTAYAAVKLFTTNKRFGTNLIPLYRLSMNEAGLVGHDYTTGGLHDAYVLDGIEGYIYPPETTPQPAGTVELLRRYHSGNKDYVIFPSSQASQFSTYGTPPIGPASLGYVCVHGVAGTGVCRDVHRPRSDFNDNKRADILWRNAATGHAFMQLMDGSTIVSYSAFHSEPDLNWGIVGTGDFDGDRKADILWRNKVTGDVRMQRMDGATIVSSQVVYSEPNLDWEIAATADYNGDGKADILWRNKASGQIFLLLMDGFSIVGGQVIYTEPDLNWKIMSTGDYNGDGKADILWRNVATGDVFMQLMNGFTVSSSNVIYSEPNQDWKIIGSGDFNGDSRSDILWFNSTTGAVFIQIMQGLSIAEGAGVYTESNTNWSIVAIADYNGDGRADLLWRNALNGQVYLMPMNGLTVQTGQVIYTEPDQNWKIIQ